MLDGSFKIVWSEQRSDNRLSSWVQLSNNFNESFPAFTRLRPQTQRRHYRLGNVTTEVSIYNPINNIWVIDTRFCKTGIRPIPVSPSAYWLFTMLLHLQSRR